MSNMGQMIVEIEERYNNGQSVEDIARYTKTSPEFIDDVVRDSIMSDYEEYSSLQEK